MDLSFRFDRLRAGVRPATIDAAMLLATHAAAQATGPTAIVAARSLTSPGAAIDSQHALVALFGGVGDWAEAGRALGGSFHPRVAAAAAGKAGSTLMKPGFTFAF